MTKEQLARLDRMEKSLELIRKNAREWAEYGEQNTGNQSHLRMIEAQAEAGLGDG